MDDYTVLKHGRLSTQSYTVYLDIYRVVGFFYFILFFVFAAPSTIIIFFDRIKRKMTDYMCNKCIKNPNCEYGNIWWSCCRADFLSQHLCEMCGAVLPYTNSTSQWYFFLSHKSFFFLYQKHIFIELTSDLSQLPSAVLPTLIFQNTLVYFSKTFFYLLKKKPICLKFQIFFFSGKEIYKASCRSVK